MYLPRWTLALTAAYPFLAYWLIWGGTILSPIVAAVGFAVGYVAFTTVERRGFVTGLAAGIVAGLVGLVDRRCYRGGTVRLRPAGGRREPGDGRASC